MYTLLLLLESVAIFLSVDDIWIPCVISQLWYRLLEWDELSYVLCNQKNGKATQIQSSEQSQRKEVRKKSRRKGDARCNRKKKGIEQEKVRCYNSNFDISRSSISILTVDDIILVLEVVCRRLLPDRCQPSSRSTHQLRWSRSGSCYRRGRACPRSKRGWASGK